MLRSTAVRVGRISAGDALAWLVLVLGAAVMLFPVYWIFVTAVTPKGELFSRELRLWPSSLDWSNFSQAWSQLPWTRWYFNSFLIAIVSVIITVSINLLAGYTFAKYRFPGRNIIFFLMISTLMVPIQVLLIPRFVIVARLGWINTYWSIIFPHAAEAFGIFLVRQFMVSIPDDLIEAARLDGASEFTIFRRVVVPLSGPVIAVLIILTFMWRWNGFAWPLVALTDQEMLTVQLGLNFMKGYYYTEWGQIMAMVLLSLVPILIVFVTFQRYFIQGIASTGLK